MVNQDSKAKLFIKKAFLDFIFIILCLLIAYFIFVGHIFIAKITQKDLDYAVLMGNISIINIGISLIICLILIVALSWIYEKTVNKDN